MFFTEIEPSDQFQIRLDVGAEALEGTRRMVGLRPRGTLDFGRLLAGRDPISMDGITAVVLDADPQTLDALRDHLDGPTDIAAAFLWEDGSDLGTYTLRAARRVAEDDDGFDLTEVEPPEEGAERLVLAVERVDFT